MTADVLATPDTPGSPDALPLLGGRYELREVLGRGGMADVRAALDHRIGRTVAVKLLRNPADATQRARFISEARTLARLSHANIVGLLDAGLDDDVPYLVMEFAAGRTLAELARSGPLEPSYVAAVGAQVAEALAHAHATGVVHRDVKPSNVIVSDEGHARLADFGIAKLIGEADRHTRTDETVGSPAYLSPEQVSGTEVTAAIDVYSLGLVLLEALTGRRAYSGTPVEAAIARLRTAPLIPTSLGPAWCTLLERMTRLDPEQRPGAAEVAAALCPLAGGTTSVVTPATLERTGTFSWAAAQEDPTSMLQRAGAGGARRGRRTAAGLVAAGASAALVALGMVLTAPAPTTAAEPGTPVPDWSGRIFDELFLVPAVTADPRPATERPRTARTQEAAVTPKRAQPRPNKDVVPGKAKKAERPGKGTPGRPGRR